MSKLDKLCGNIILNTEIRTEIKLKTPVLTIVTSILTYEYLSIDIENSFSNLLQNGEIPNLIELNQYNKTRKMLFFTKEITLHFYSNFIEFENYFIVGTNLHSLWDSGIIEYKKITLQDCLKANNYSKNEIRAIQYTNVVNWATDTRAYLPQIYKTGGNKINEEYVDSNVPLIENQILKAGIRLAGVLNNIFKNGY